jgi:hypothetical protein
VRHPSSRVSTMRLKALIVLILALGNVTADVSAVLAAAVCPAPATAKETGTMTCCCGPAACPETQVPGAGLAPRCCSMGRNERPAETSSSPASPETGATSQTVAPAGTILNSIFAPPEAGLPALADAGFGDHRAPPLYDLFRAYRN